MGHVRSRAAITVLALVAGGCLQDASRRPPSPTPPATHAAATPDARAAFGRAVALYERGALNDARPLFQTLLRSYPTLEDYHLAYLAAIAERDGDMQTAIGYDDRLLATHAASVWAPTAAARRARVALALGDPRAEEFAERARTLGDADATARATALAVLAALRAPTNPPEAYGLYQEVRKIGAESAAHARDAATELETTHPELLHDPELQLAEGRVLASEGRLDLAAERLEVAVSSEAVDRVEALRALAKVRQQQGRIEDAIAAYRRAVALAPTGNLARFELASLFWNRDRDADARALFTAILAESPRHPKYETARYALARIAEQEGQTEEAIAQYRELAATGEGDLAREARWRLAWMPYRRGDLTAAGEAFAALGAGNDKDRPASLYWRGRVFARAGNTTESRAQFELLLQEAPDGYYADLAEHALASSAPPPPPPTRLPATPPPSVALHAYHWDRSVELRLVGMNGASVREIAALARELPDGGTAEPFLLEAYTEVEAHDRAVRLADRVGSAVDAATLAAYQYPRAYWPRVTAAADAERIDPYLVLAVMRQESLFDPEAVSPAAAYGLLQLLVSTASHVAGRPMTAGALVDPTTNITLGARYLRRLLDRFDGDVAKAVAAYNGGEDAVAKWERRAPDTATDEFVETISYRETRHYVKQVLGNYRRYRRLYGAPGEQRAVDRAYDDGGRSSAASSFAASPPNPPFDINTTTSPGAT